MTATTMRRTARAHISAQEILEACQRIAVHIAEDDVIDETARAALALSGGEMCAIFVTTADGAPRTRAWERVRGTEFELVAGESRVGATSSGPRLLELVTTADGQARCRVVVHGVDDAGTLDHALAPLLTQLDISLRHASLYADLEGLVVREMQTSVEREQSMRVVLDSMQDGLLVCELDGALTHIRSRPITALFGEPPADARVWDFLARSDHAFAFTFRLGWEQLVSDVLPFELAAMQMPAQMVLSDRTYHFSFQRVDRDGAMAQIAVSVQDVSAELAARTAHEIAAELAAVVGTLTADREGFFAFLDETRRLLDELAARPEPVLQRHLLHTLKGNTAVYGFLSFSRTCHEIEDELIEHHAIGTDGVARLHDAWERSIEHARPFLGVRSQDGLTVRKDELAAIVERLRGANVDADVVTELEQWAVEPLGPALDRLGRQALRIAALQGKQLKIEVEGGRVRTADARVKEVLAVLVHAIRNAVDHGLEPPDERTLAGKPPDGRLTISCMRTQSGFVFEVRDDGRGIDWGRLRAKAIEVGYGGTSREQLMEVLFLDGMSTATEVTTTSGRGVGMGALRAACRSMGGGVHIESDPGRGTRVICAIEG